MNIQDYLVPAEIAKWAKDKEFKGECAKSELISYLTYKGAKKAKIECVNLPTFSQLFDWCEEKWGFKIKPDHGSIGGPLYSYFISKQTINVTPKQYRFYHDTKREARIAACDAIISYVETLK